jgi:hypothetical protein
MGKGFLAWAMWAVGCSGAPGMGADGGADLSADGPGVTCPPVDQPSPVALGGAVALAAAGDLDGDGRLDLLVAPAAGGVASFRASPCGLLEAKASALPGVQLTGLDSGQLVGATFDAIAFADDKTLYALAGGDLSTRWKSSSFNLATAGQAVAAHLAADTSRHHVALFDDTHSKVLRVQNTGSGWTVRAELTLPAGIERVQAGELGGSTRDELLFEGGGLVEVVSTADFNYSDVRPLTFAAHAAAAFGDFDGDGQPDAATGAGMDLELWKGDGTATIANAGATTLDAAVADLAAFDRDGDGKLELAALLDGGDVLVARWTGSAWTTLARKPTAAGAIRIFAGPLDGDTHADLIIVDGSGQAFVWRSP